jgi:ATP-dependent RNA helicase HrpA
MTIAQAQVHLKKLSSLIGRVMAPDKQRFRRELKGLKDKQAGKHPSEKIEAAAKKLEKQIRSSIHKRSLRRKNAPMPAYNESLPIFAKKDEIIEAMGKHQVLIVSGETGSGKTTQIPKFCLAAGRGIDGKIGCTQPRRIAAITVCQRIAEELGEEPGKSVGYKIRFKDKTREASYIKIMTDGILLAETQSDPYLAEYDTLIVDEAHERNLNIDFVLGILKTLLKKRKDLKVIITSATIDTEKFSKAFGNAPVVEVSGRLYPVDVRYFPVNGGLDENDEQTHVESAVAAFDELRQGTTGGDVLIFMPTEQDILETIEVLEGRKYTGITVLPLYARLPAREQSRAFSQVRGQKIIIATNIAETSITIPGIRYVIDTGLARISQYSPRTRTTSLPVVPVSRSSADQRKGRCGRVENGICIRLYSEEDYLSRPLFTAPEILRANLAEVILRMISLRLGDVPAFPFIDRPAARSIRDGFDLLFELGAITDTAEKTESKGEASPRLTRKGRLMARMPIDPRLSRILIEGKKEGCLKEIAVIAAALSIQDPRERPSDKCEAADLAHKTFADPSSDFTTFLNIWNTYHRKWRSERSNNRMKKFCRTAFLSYKRTREWRDIHAQLFGILQDCGILAPGLEKSAEAVLDIESTVSDSKYAAIHRSLLSGFLSNIATKKEKNIFKATKGREVMVFPGSGLFNRAGQWIVAAEVVETTRTFARTTANIDKDWLEDLGRDQCTYHYYDPHWEKDREQVVAYEQVNLYGLTIVAGRKVSYGRIHPEEASEIFIRDALVEGEVRQPMPFMTHNQKLIDHIIEMENRFRRRDLLVGKDDRVKFYQQRLKEIYDLAALKKRIKQEGNDQFLRMTREDLLLYEPAEDELSLFPDTVQLGDRRFSCDYRFEPGKTDDGVTVKLPCNLAASIPLEPSDWVVPGLLEDKISALIKTLPKIHRKKLVPVSRTVATIVKEMPKTKGSLITALSRFIARRFGVDIPAPAWSQDALPEHLSMRIVLTGPQGEELHASRNRNEITKKAMGEIRHDATEEFQSAKTSWERTGIIEWDFGDLPDAIPLKGKNAAGWTAYPGLKETENPRGKNKEVELRLFTNAYEAIEAHQAGVAVLLFNYLSKDLKFLKKQLMLPRHLRQPADYFGGTLKVEKRLFDSVISDLFKKNIRTERGFLSHAAEAEKNMTAYGKHKLARVASILEAFHECRSALYRLEKENRDNASFLDFFSRLRRELSKLIPETFMDIYSAEQMIRLEKYIQAITIRAQRGIINYEKDKIRAEEFTIFTDKLDGLLAALEPATSQEKRVAIEEFFWLIEEYKVSLFAQELKTSVPVSKKRLEKKLKAIERMI